MERNGMKETDGSSEVSAEVMTKSGVWFLARRQKRQEVGMSVELSGWMLKSPDWDDEFAKCGSGDRTETTDEHAISWTTEVPYLDIRRGTGSLGHRVSGSFGSSFTSRGHRVIILTRCETRVRTETTTKKCKTEKLKSENGYAQK